MAHRFKFYSPPLPPLPSPPPSIVGVLWSLGEWYLKKSGNSKQKETANESISKAVICFVAILHHFSPPKSSSSSLSDQLPFITNGMEGLGGEEKDNTSTTILSIVNAKLGDIFLSHSLSLKKAKYHFNVAIDLLSLSTFSSSTHSLTLLSCYRGLVEVFELEGSIPIGKKIIQKAFSLSSSPDFLHWRLWFLAKEADLLLSQGKFRSAYPLLLNGREKCKKEGLFFQTLSFTLSKAQVELCRNEIQKSLKTLNEFHQHLSSPPPPSPLLHQAQELQIQAAILQMFCEMKKGNYSKANEILTKMEKEQAKEGERREGEEGEEGEEGKVIHEGGLLKGFQTTQILFSLTSALCRRPYSPSLALSHLSTGLNHINSIQKHLRDVPLPGHEKDLLLPTSKVKEYYRSLWVEFLFLENEASIECLQGDISKAVTTIRRAVDLVIAHDLLTAHPSTFLRLLYTLFGCLGGEEVGEGVEDYLREAVRVCGEKEKGETRVLLCCCLMKGGKVEEAKELLAGLEGEGVVEGLSKGKKWEGRGVGDGGKGVGTINYLYVLGLLNLHCGSFSVSRSFLSRALSLCPPTLNGYLRARVMLCLGVVDVCEKRFSSASLCFEKANTLASSMNDVKLKESVALAQNQLNNSLVNELLPKDEEYNKEERSDQNEKGEKPLAEEEERKKEEALSFIFPPRQKSMDSKTMKEEKSFFPENSVIDEEGVIPFGEGGKKRKRETMDDEKQQGGEVRKKSKTREEQREERLKERAANRKKREEAEEGSEKKEEEGIREENEIEERGAHFFSFLNAFKNTW